MFLHPSTLLFFSILIMTIMFMLSATSWFSAWLILEINLMAFIPMMLKKKSKYSTESVLKYFLIQAFSSILLILLANLYMVYNNIAWVITLTLFLKIGMAPLHQWFISITDGLSWETLLIIMLIQKINPFILLSLIYKTNQTLNLSSIFILTSAVLGAVGGLTQSSTPKILAFSSISHMGWMVALVSLGSWLWLVYFMLYFIVLSPLIYLLHIHQIFSLSKMFLTPHFFLLFSMSLYLLSITGMPPFTGFMPKLLALSVLLPSSSNFLILALLISTFVSLFFYLRLTLANMLISHSMNMLTYNYHKYSTSLFNSLMLLFMPPFALMII